MLNPAPAKRGHLRHFAYAVPLGEQPDRLKMPRLARVGARNISFTPRLDALKCAARIVMVRPFATHARDHHRVVILIDGAP